ncbi:MAG: hypothetical protein QGF59_06100, partial [Pirellulaceae bacterium]|nr:hypothetical protein [Pirellulaceae bacterium]
RRGRGRERELNTLNVIDFRPNTIHVTHYMYFDDTGCFEPINNHDFPRRGKRLPNGVVSRDR